MDTEYETTQISLPIRTQLPTEYNTKKTAMSVNFIANEIFVVCRFVIVGEHFIYTLMLPNQRILSSKEAKYVCMCCWYKCLTVTMNTKLIGKSACSAF